MRVLTRASLRSPAFVFPRELYNLSPCNIASSKHLGSWENTSVALGNNSAAPRVLPTSRVFRWGILHGNALYIPKLSSLGDGLFSPSLNCSTYSPGSFQRDVSSSMRKARDTRLKTAKPTAVHDWHTWPLIENEFNLVRIKRKEHKVNFIEADG